LYYGIEKKTLINQQLAEYKEITVKNQQVLLSKINSKKNLLSIIESLFLSSEEVTVSEFATFTNGLIDEYELIDICLIKPEQNIIFSAKFKSTDRNESNCYEFDVLSQSKIFDDSAPKLMLSKFINTSGDMGVFTSIILDLNSLISDEKNYGFDEHFIILNKSDDTSIDYSINEKALVKVNLEIDKVLDHTYHQLESFDETDFFYLSQFKKENLKLENLNKVFAISLLILLFFSISAFFIRNLIIQKKLVEEHVRAKTKELKESQSFLSLIMSHNPDLVFVKDEDFKIVEANEAFINLYPEDKRDSIISTTTIEDYDEKEAELFLANDKKALKEGFAEAIESIMFPDNQRRILYTKKIRFEDYMGKPYILGISRDVTEREHLLENLQRSNEELSQFAYRTSHDLKSPLTTIKGLAKYIDEDLKTGDINEAQENVIKIVLQAEKLENLVIDILNLARADLQEGHEINAIDFSKIINDCCSKYETLIKDKNIDIRFNKLTDETFYSETVRVTQILDNLIANAIKYSDSKKANSYVEISIQSSDTNWHISCLDNGLGIPLGKEKDIFKIFQRFHPDASDGTGMGLSIIKRHIDKLDGKISVNTINNQTNFEIEFPIKKD
jgi:PAS domain S-box-containing protein